MKVMSLIAIALLVCTARAETPEQVFDEANQAYQQGKYPEAIQKYEQILQSGLLNGELYYNLGNAYYKAGNVSKAILNYERALKWMPNDEDLQHNLQLANLMITDRIEPTPRLFIWDWWDAIKSAFSLTGITWLSYMFFVLLSSSIVLTMLAGSYRLRRVGVVSAAASLFLLCFGLIIFTGKLNALQSTDAAIVTTSIATAKNSPDAKSSDAFVLHSGVKVTITDKVNDWLKIRLADGKVGWLEEKAVERI